MSFTRIKQKPLLSIHSKIWLLFILISSGVIIALFLYLRVDIFSTNTKLKNIDNMIKASQSQQAKTTSEFNLKMEQKLLAQNIYASNSTLGQSLNSLFDLVPESVVVSEILMDKDSLLIRGKTPNTEVFKALLQTPLKSIFDESETSFYQLDDGYYNFSCVNRIIDKVQGE